jgi:hypothetical protein
VQARIRRRRKTLKDSLRTPCAMRLSTYCRKSAAVLDCSRGLEMTMPPGRVKSVVQVTETDLHEPYCSRDATMFSRRPASA